MALEIAFMNRDHILAEIRRTTDENAGTPLGRIRFQAETGVREHEWSRYWPRWSEALREAGIEGRNQFNVAIPDDTLLERLAAFTREIGKFPVQRELKVKSKADPEFPAVETYRRFGSVVNLAERLRAFCNSRGYEDVAALCPVAKESAATERSARQERSVELGSVYLMKSGKYFKIGHTNAVGRRERELSIQLPEKLRVVHAISTDDPAGIEEYWHRRFAARRRNGEWFDLSADDVSAFRRRKMM